MVALETRARASLEAVANNLLPERENRAWKAGWLAGMFDTDGMYGGKNLRWSQSKDPTVLERVATYGQDLGINIKIEIHPGGGCPTAIVLGRVEDKIRALGTMRPALERKCRDFVGRRVASTTATAVDGVRRVGDRELVDIQTSSGTFIAAGLASHNCYALTLAKRLKAMGQPKYQLDGDPRTSGPGFKLTCHEEALDIPLRWGRGRLIFVNSMSDLFHPDVPVEFIEKVLDVARRTPQHIYQVLTKRARRLEEVGAGLDWPSNVWMGVSIETDRYSFRAGHLRATPSAVRFLSLER